MKIDFKKIVFRVGALALPVGMASAAAVGIEGEYGGVETLVGKGFDLAIVIIDGLIGKGSTVGILVAMALIVGLAVYLLKKAEDAAKAGGRMLPK